MNVRNCLAAPQETDEPKVASLTLAQAPSGSVIIARPLMEGWVYIRNFKLPPFELVARSIKVLALGIFRGHLCDHIMISTYKGIFHSLKGRVEHENFQSFQTTYPYMLESAFVLKFDRIMNCHSDPALQKIDDEPLYCLFLNSDEYVKCSKLREKKEINAQIIWEYYSGNFGIEITKNKVDNSIKDILISNNSIISSF